MINPMALLSGKQKQQMAKMQELTKKIKYIIHTDDSKNLLQITLETEDPEAAKVLPQIREAVVNSTTQTLYQMFAMKGERI